MYELETLLARQNEIAAALCADTPALTLPDDDPLRAGKPAASAEPAETEPAAVRNAAQLLQSLAAALQLEQQIAALRQTAGTESRPGASVLPPAAGSFGVAADGPAESAPAPAARAAGGGWDMLAVSRYFERDARRYG